MGVLFNGQRPGDVLLHRTSDAVQATDAGIAQIAEDQLRRDSCGNHLVVDQIRGHATKHEIALVLADNFVGGREANERGEALDGERAAVCHVVGDCLVHGYDFVVCRHAIGEPVDQ